MKKLLLMVLVAVILVSSPFPSTSQIANASSHETYAADVDLTNIKDDLTNINNELVDRAKELFDKLQDVKDHWAAEAIRKAIERGYVNGYADFTFRPNAPVSRAEFIKMVVAAIGLDTSSVPQGTKWYDPYVNAAIRNNLITATEYKSGDYNTHMTRMEMARVSVRAIGLTASSDEEYMYLATKNGLITGVGNGKLAENDTTTRAQAVTIIERILKVRNGETLPVDEKAVANAEQAMKTPKDPWGRKIRTTNLPKNYKDYPYILEEVPNEMYEKEFIYYLKSLPTMTPLEVSKLEEYDIVTITNWANLVKQWGSQLLNVDYKTIGEDWVKNYTKSIVVQGSQVEKNSRGYVEWVKKNEIQIEGEIRPEPSIIHYGDGKFWVRAYFQFRIKNYKEEKNIIFDLYYQPGKYKKGGWYEGYVDIPLINTVMNDIRWDNYKVATTASIFENAVIREKK
jgi:S-layer homology domain.